MKRFITNGCGEVLLVLARSEPEITDGRGLSLFITERSPRVRVRHLEKKLGIHGSPTCELVFDDTPCRLIGERQRGLITYVMALMNGARVGIAAQSLGVAEAAFRLARTYAHTRQQFGGPIERLPAVAEMVTDMKIDIEAARALAYETSRVCDHENNNARVLEWGGPLDKDEEKRRKQLGRGLKRINGMLTPMSKYYCSEMACRVARPHDPGAGRLRLHEGLRRRALPPRQPHHHDLRGHQPVAGRGGRPRRLLRQLRACGPPSGSRRATPSRSWPGSRRSSWRPSGGSSRPIQFVKTKPASYLDLSGRRLVDSAIAVMIGHLFLGQGAANAAEAAGRPPLHRARAARSCGCNCEQILSGDMAALEEYAMLAGPVPAAE